MTSPMTAEARTDAELVVAARNQEAGAYGELFQRWYDRSFDIALNILRDGEAAADVAQDAFLTGWERLEDLRAPAAFGGWILRTTRNRALNRLSRDRARSHEPIDEERDPSSNAPDPGTDPAVLAEREDQRRLVWTAVAVLGERDTSLLDLHLRHGLEPAEIAEELHITANNASQLLFRLRRKLRDAIGAVLLWRDGKPSCDALADLLADSGTFDLTVASVIRQHRRSCPVCNRELSLQTDPERLFAAVPFAVAPLMMKDHAIAALTQLGAPMAASSVATSTAVSASAAASASGLSAKMIAIGGGVIGFGLLITIGLWPSGPGGDGSAHGAIPVTEGPTPTVTATPTDTASPETQTTGPTDSASTESIPEDTTTQPETSGPGGGDTGEPSDPTTPSLPVPSSTSPIDWELPSWELPSWELPDWNLCEWQVCHLDLSWLCCGSGHAPVGHHHGSGCHSGHH